MTRYYYWKKKFDQPKATVGLIPIKIHNEGSGSSVIIGTQPREISGVSLAFPNGLRVPFWERLRTDIGGSITKKSWRVVFSLNDTMRYHLCTGFTEMGKGINSLIGVIRERLGS